MRDRLHGYTKRTLGAGGSVTEAVSSNAEYSMVHSLLQVSVSGCDDINSYAD